MDEFLIRAALAGVLISLLSAPLGCFMVWRKMSYYGATIAHGGLLGVALGIIFSLNLSIAVLITTLALTLLLYFLKKLAWLPTDTLLGIIAHVALAAGVLLAGWVNKEGSIDLMDYLFGDILAVMWRDIALIALLSLSGLWLVYTYREELLLISLHPEMAAGEGVDVKKMDILYLVLLALIIAIAMKIIGILLITSLLIIPAATARRFASEPEQMAVAAIGISVLSVILGLTASWFLDSQTGPTIILVMAMLFAVSLMARPQN